MFPGAGTPGAGERCFVAVWPPADLTGRILASQRPPRPGLHWTRAEQWHVTLKFFAAVDAASLVSALDRVAATPPGWPAAEAVAGPAPRTMGRRLWVVPVAGLDDLAAAVDSATSGLGPGDPVPRGGDGGAGEAPTRRFEGHITLARARRPPALRHLPLSDVGGRWEVDAIGVVRSRLGPGGAHHQLLRRWPVPSVFPGRR